MSVEVFPYPANVPDCQQIDAESFGVACEPCPFAPECGYLALSTEFIETKESIKVQLLNERIEGNRDDLLPGFYNRKAVRAMIEKDPTIGVELLQGRSAIVMIDVRGLSTVNNLQGMDSGDMHLVHSGQRLIDQSRSVRSSSRPEKVPQTRQDAPDERPLRNADIGIRDGKADEMFVLLRDITPTDLPKVVKRLRKVFSVETSITDGNNERWPIPATVSSAHSAEITIRERDTALDVFDKTYATVRQRHNNLKTAQYAEMWQRVCEKTGVRDLRVPDEPRKIYEKFIQHCCGDFIRKLAHSDPQDES